MRAQFADSLATRAVDASPALATKCDQAGMLEDAEVLRDRWSRDVKEGGDVAHRSFLAPDEPQDVAAPRLGDRAQGLVHGALG